MGGARGLASVACGQRSSAHASCGADSGWWKKTPQNAAFAEYSDREGIRASLMPCMAIPLDGVWIGRTLPTAPPVAPVVQALRGGDGKPRQVPGRGRCVWTLPTARGGASVRVAAGACVQLSHEHLTYLARFLSGGGLVMASDSRTNAPPGVVYIAIGSCNVVPAQARSPVLLWRRPKWHTKPVLTGQRRSCSAGRFPPSPRAASPEPARPRC